MPHEQKPERQTDTGRNPGIRSVKRSSGIRSVRKTSQTGRPFFDALVQNPSLSHLAAPIEQLATDLSHGASPGYETPQLEKVRRKAADGTLLTQHDRESCTRFALANALILLDSARPQYTPDALNAQLARLGVVVSTDIMRSSMHQLVASGNPFDRFYIVRQPENPSERENPVDTARMYLKYLRYGAIGTIGYAYSPDPAHEFGHQRTLVGYRQETPDSISLELIDPYQPHHVVMQPLIDVLAGMAIHSFNYNRTYIPSNPPVTYEQFLLNLSDYRNIMMQRIEFVAGQD